VNKKWQLKALFGLGVDCKNPNISLYLHITKTGINKEYEYE
jgi:hypothetical protein